MKAHAALCAVGLLAFSLAPALGACGSTNQAEIGDAAPEFNEDANPNQQYTPEELWANDPPLKWCGPAGGPAEPPPPGGTPDCPTDKNREGCPCDEVGKEAACWPGARANRDLGVCKDGKTVCKSQGEIAKVWGPCEGYRLPTKGVTKGKEACGCFSQGQWKIDNVVPCFVSNNGDHYALSSKCPPQGSPVPEKKAPTEAWSKNTLTVDCAGHFKLCYTIKGGDVNNPQPTDCALTTQCTEGDYLEADKPQAFPDLAGWVSNDSACVKAMQDGGPLYGEMTVIGKSVRCDDISVNGEAFVFNRIPYCKLTDTTCTTSGAGTF